MNGKRTTFNNEALLEIRKDLEALIECIDEVTSEQKTMTKAFDDHGFNKRTIRFALKELLSAHTTDDSNVETRKTAYKMVDIGLLTPTEAIYCEVFNLDGKTSEVLSFMPENAEEVLRQVMNDDLTEREREVINMRYYEEMSLGDVANIFTVTKERIRQVENKAIRKLRHPLRKRKLRFGLKFEDEFKKAYDDAYKEAIDIATKKGTEYALKTMNQEYSIDDLDLSVRAYNALYRQNVRTINKLLALSLEDLLKFQNLGRKSVIEVIQKVRDKVDVNYLPNIDISNGCDIIKKEPVENGDEYSLTKESIENLDLTFRTRNVLHSNGIYTIEDLTKLTFEEFYNMKGVGTKTFTDIIINVRNNYDPEFMPGIKSNEELLELINEK